ncbi:helix-turn-helix transcriptional regulator [Sphingomonas sp. UBA978]|uniref:helix-turn-helix transcriptional regulator n=1 Tax=Sphingomonas sp. UBA978 TaxID=1947536 RepID=UPI0025FF223A|nr:helix-turn-helix domain-containing protein [Sphingomonas sp. UBA978]
MQKLLTTKEAAPLVGVRPKTLENWRVLGRGPQHIRAGRNIAYDVSDIEAWKAGRRVSSTSQPVAA